MRLALRLEKVLTKDQILQNYLNIAAFGHGAYGIYAASQVYFNKEPKDLTLAEAALLAGLPKAPSDVRPDHRDRPPAGAGAARRTCSTRWSSIGMITQASRPTRPRQAELKVTGKRTPNGCVATTVQRTGASSATSSTAGGSQQKAFGADAAEREQPAQVRRLPDHHHAGRRASQDVGEEATSRSSCRPATGRADAGRDRAGHRHGSRRWRPTATTASTPASNRPRPPTRPRRRRASRAPTRTRPTRCISGGGDISGYKAGSTFKMFTMLAALEKGYPLDFTINAPIAVPVAGLHRRRRATPAPAPDKLHWCPQNASPAT